VLGALVGLDPRHITDIVWYAGDAASTISATFKLRQPGTFELSSETVQRADLPELRSDRRNLSLNRLHFTPVFQNPQSGFTS
jgi:hypothetical protein